MMLLSEPSVPRDDLWLALAVAEDASMTATWLAIQDGTDHICVREMEAGAARPVEILTHSESARCTPTIAVDSVGTFHVAWLEYHDGRGYIIERHGRAGSWSAPQAFGLEHETAISQTLIRGRDGRIWLAWGARSRDSSVLRIQRVAGDPAKEQRVVYLGGDEPRRLRGIGTSNGGLTLIWDAYDGRIYGIYVCRITPEDSPSSVERIDPGDGWCLHPAICEAGDGSLIAVWIHEHDVQNDLGVIDQWQTLRAAVHRDEQWEPCGDGPEGQVAELLHSLLAKTAVWGYLGRRRYPMLIPDEAGNPWLLWERKQTHDGLTAVVPGVLCGRQYNGHRWSPPVEVASGFRYYVLDETSPLSGKGFWAVATRPEDLIHITQTTHTREPFLLVHFASPSLDHSPSLHTEPWTGWRRIELRGERTSERPTVQVRDRQLTLFWGDPHVHSRLSEDDGQGEYDEILHYARDKTGLDFVCITDNDCYMKPMAQGEWVSAQAENQRFEIPGQFIPLTGYEWSARVGHNEVEHRSVLFHTPEGNPLLRWNDMAESVSALLRGLQGHDALLHAHHATWRLAEDPREANVEVASGWKVYFDQPETIHEALRNGRRIGFIGGSDGHRRNPGAGGALTGVWATELTRKALFDALAAHRTIATTGSRIVLQFFVEDHFIGEQAVAAGPPRLHGHVVSPMSLVGPIQAFRDGTPIMEWQTRELAFEFEWIDRDVRPGRHFYYLRVGPKEPTPALPSNVAVAFGDKAWSSPIWVDIR